MSLNISSAAWSIKAESEITPPAPNSSQSNFSPNEKSESRGKTWETSEMMTHYGTRPLWRLYEVRKWQMFTAGSTGVWKVSQPEAAAQPEHDTGPQMWQGGFTWAGEGMCSGDPDPGGESPKPALSASDQSKSPFLTLISKIIQKLQPKLFPQLPCIYSSENQLCGLPVFEYFHKKLLHLTIPQQCPQWKPRVMSPWGPSPDPWFQQLFPISGIHPWVSRLWITTKENHTSAATNIWYFKYFTSTVMCITLGWLVVN